MNRTVRGLVAAAAAVVVLAGPVALPAAAADAVPDGEAFTSDLVGANCLDTEGNPLTERVSEDHRDTVAGVQAGRGYLPLNRWGDVAAGMHTRLGSMPWSDMSSKAMRGLVISGSLNVSNSMWQMSSGMIEFATQFSILDQAGCEADRFAARLGDALFDSGVISLLLVATVVLLVWRAAKPRGGRADWAAVGKAAGMVALLFIMVNGAQRTVATGQIQPGSPAWFATSVDSVVSDLASRPATALSIDRGDLDDDRHLHCSRYIRNLKLRYQAEVDAAGLASATGAVPLVMSSMWEQSGLRVWHHAQFGSRSDDGWKVGCRLLEHRFGVDVDEARELTGPPGRPSQLNVAVFRFTSRDQADIRLVGWAACTGGSSVALQPGWDRNAILDDEHITHDDCREWGQGGDDADELPDGSWVLGDGSSLNWTPDEAKIRGVIVDPETRDFMLNLHGDVIGGALTASILFVFISMVFLFVFGALALGIIVAKIASIVVVVMAVLVVAWSILPGRDGSNKLAQFSKFYVGLTVFSFGLQFILALVAALTKFIVDAGGRAFEPGTAMAILWMAFAPITAMIVVHMVFTKGLRAPSPFKLSSAMAYGGAMAGGAAMGIGLDRLTSRGRGLARNVSRGAAAGWGEKLTSGRGKGKGGDSDGGPAGGRDQEMQPDDSEKKSRREKRQEKQEARKEELREAGEAPSQKWEQAREETDGLGAAAKAFAGKTKLGRSAKRKMETARKLRSEEGRSELYRKAKANGRRKYEAAKTKAKTKTRDVIDSGSWKRPAALAAGASVLAGGPAALAAGAVAAATNPLLAGAGGLYAARRFLKRDRNDGNSGPEQTPPDDGWPDEDPTPPDGGPPKPPPPTETSGPWEADQHRYGQAQEMVDPAAHAPPRPVDRPDQPVPEQRQPQRPQPPPNAGRREDGTYTAASADPAPYVQRARARKERWARRQAEQQRQQQQQQGQQRQQRQQQQQQQQQPPSRDERPSGRQQTQPSPQQPSPQRQPSQDRPAPQPQPPPQKEPRPPQQPERRRKTPPKQPDSNDSPNRDNGPDQRPPKR